MRSIPLLSRRLGASAVPVFLALLVQTAIAATPCESLASQKLPSITLAATLIPAGAYKQPNGRGMPNLPAFCRVSGVIKPSDDSDIHFEVWMPAENWSGRFEGIGNGGYAGSISPGALAAAISRGSAAAATDTGHNGGATAADWALGHPQKVIDFGYRAIHLTAESAKVLIAAFYGNGPRHSYFDSCSNGGRQALMEAQRYPEDYDGIVAGAPAYYWTHLLTGAAWLAQSAQAHPDEFIPPAKVAMLQDAVLAACDLIDGVRDGVLNDPTKCKFDPGTLLCKSGDAADCLTALQVDLVRHVYGGTRDSAGHSIVPGFYPGGESGPGGWSTWITGVRQGAAEGVSYGSQFYRNMVFEDANWSNGPGSAWTVDSGVKAADAKLASTLNATAADLAKFQARGGKLILFHGWNDPAIPAQFSIDYYNSVVSKMGAKKAAAFTRLYMVPGMQHCAGGPGATSFDDMLPQIEKWVEDNQPPGTVVATKFKTEGNRASGVLRTRPLCSYPQSAQWDGKGNPDDAASFTCK
jgi:hypothetical protein